MNIISHWILTMFVIAFVLVDADARRCARKCRRKRDGDYAHCENCSKYVTCSNKVMYERDCPSGLEWDDRTRRCDWGPSPTCTANTIDGEWATWTAYGTCSVSCGGGDQTRTRTCNDPAPTTGGADCAGNPSESRDCNDQGCCDLSCPATGHPNPDCNVCLCPGDQYAGQVLGEGSEDIISVQVYVIPSAPVLAATSMHAGIFIVSGYCIEGLELLFEKTGYEPKVVSENLSRATTFVLTKIDTDQ